VKSYYVFSQLLNNQKPTYKNYKTFRYVLNKYFEKQTITYISYC